MPPFFLCGKEKPRIFIFSTEGTEVHRDNICMAYVMAFLKMKGDCYDDLSDSGFFDVVFGD